MQLNVKHCMPRCFPAESRPHDVISINRKRNKTTPKQPKHTGKKTRQVSTVFGGKSYFAAVAWFAVACSFHQRWDHIALKEAGPSVRDEVLKT